MRSNNPFNSPRGVMNFRAMKLIALALTTLIAITFLPISLQAKQMNDAGTEARLKALEDRAELKALVDTFSNLADGKEIAEQVLLFTPDAEVESYFGYRLVSKLHGREEIAKAFGGYLSQFDVVYHMNGQQTVELQGDHATGTSYCLVVLIGTRDGKQTRETSGVIYHDVYVRTNGGWLISKRTSRFTWQDSEVIS